MRWFKTRYVASLEMEISRLRTENDQLKKRIENLSERLFTGNGTRPTVELPAEQSAEAMDKMLQATNIFDDIDDVPETGELVDNRKEKFDEFVS